MTATAGPTTEQGLVRACLERPSDDAPRLVYADWLDEHGEPERAEFIRVQIEIAATDMEREREWDPQSEVELSLVIGREKRNLKRSALRMRERNLLAAAPAELPHWLVWAGFDSYSAVPAGMKWEWSRGFVASVSLPLAVLCGGECVQCEGNRVVERPRPPGFVAGGQMTMMDDCPDCSGTGRTPGIARDLFRLHPITSVRLTDAVLLEVNGGVCWVNDDLDGCIPDAIFRRLQSPWQQTHVSQKAYFNAEEAHAYLSRAVVAWARGLASLPPLDEKAPGC